MGLILSLEGEALGNGSEKQNWTWGSRSTGRQESPLAGINLPVLSGPRNLFKVLYMGLFIDIIHSMFTVGM